MLLRSVFPAADGTPVRQLGGMDTDLRTPFERLWGGWYVTGNSGLQAHLGNATVTDASHPVAMNAKPGSAFFTGRSRWPRAFAPSG